MTPYVTPLRMFTFKGGMRAILSAKAMKKADPWPVDLPGDPQITVALSPCQWNKDSEGSGKLLLLVLGSVKNKADLAEGLAAIHLGSHSRFASY